MPESDALTTPPTTPAGGSVGGVPFPWLDWLLLGLLALVMFVLRSQGPSNLTDNDQERPAAYVLDAVANGHWVVQRDWKGAITSKPPAYTWLAAAFSSITGRVSLTSLYLPCGLAILGTAWLMYGWALRAFGPRVAWLAGLFLLANPLAAKLIALARTDAVFTFTVTLTAVLVARAWERGRGWRAAWLAAGLATLTKGPLGLLLGAAGLLAWIWERKRGVKSPASREHAMGVLAYLVVSGGWFAWAYYEVGDALVQKMLKAELLEHAVTATHGLPGAGLVLAPAYFVSRFAPWSLLALFGVYWIARRPSPAAPARSRERFAAAWLVAGVLLLGLGSHQRGDLVSPLLPAGAVLAAIPAAYGLRRVPAGWLRWGGWAAALAFVFVLQLQHVKGGRKAIAESAGMEELARRYRESGRDPQRLLCVDAPYALQFHLQTMRFTRPAAAAAAALRAGEVDAVAVRDREALEREIARAGGQARTLFAWPNGAVPKVVIVGIESGLRSPR